MYLKKTSCIIRTTVYRSKERGGMMASDMFKYVDICYAEDILLHQNRTPPTLDKNGIHHASGPFRNSSAPLFINLHPTIKQVPCPIAYLHLHEFIELVYVKKGTFFMFINNEYLQLPQGALLLINRFVPHMPWTNAADDVVVNIGIRGEQFLEYLIPNLKKTLPFLRLDSSPSMDHLIEEMFCEYFENDVYAQEVLASDLMRLLVEFYRHKQQNTLASVPSPYTPLNPAEKEIARKVKEYIYEHYIDITMNELSNHFNYSSRHMRRIIQSFSAEGLPGIVNRLKVQKACELIDVYHMPTSDILTVIGLHDANYFYKIFKKVKGISITEYRKRNG